MAIARDSTFTGVESTGIGDAGCTVACLPLGTPRLVIGTINSVAGTDQVTSCTYGGVPCVELPTLSPLLKPTTEAMATHIFYLGENVPVGLQNFVVTRTGSNSLIVNVIICTAADDCESVGAAVHQSDSASNPFFPVAPASVGGRTCFSMVGFGSGVSAPTGISPDTGWSVEYEFDHTSQCSAVYSRDAVNADDIQVLVNQAAEDFNGILVAWSEVQAATTAIPALELIPPL